MKEILKKQYKNVILVIGYIAATMAVYVVLVHNLCGYKWYLDLITAFGVLVLGLICGYFYIKAEYKSMIEKENKLKEENIGNNVLENEDKKEGEENGV